MLTSFDIVHIYEPLLNFFHELSICALCSFFYMEYLTLLLFYKTSLYIKVLTLCCHAFWKIFSQFVLFFFSFTYFIPLYKKHCFYEVRFNVIFSIILFAFYSYRDCSHCRKKQLFADTKGLKKLNCWPFFKNILEYKNQLYFE